MKEIERAMLFADSAHFGQKYGGYPYTYHLRRCMEVAESYGLDEHLAVACILHDVLEDTRTSYKDLEDSFGQKVADIVYSVTDELGKNRKERKEKTYPKIRNNVDAVVVKLIDRYCNVRCSTKSDKRMLSLYASENDEFMEGIGCSKHTYMVGEVDVIQSLVSEIKKLLL